MGLGQHDQVSAEPCNRDGLPFPTMRRATTALKVPVRDFHTLLSRLSSPLKCCRFAGGLRSAMIGFQLRAGDLRLRLCDPSKPKGAIDRSEYQRSADTLSRRTFDGGGYVDDPHSIEHFGASLGKRCVMHAVVLASGTFDAVFVLHGEIDCDGVHVGQPIEGKGGFVGDRSPLVGPQNGAEQIVVTVDREARNSVEAVTDALKRPAMSEGDETSRGYPALPCDAGWHVVTSIGGDVQQESHRGGVHGKKYVTVT